MFFFLITIKCIRVQLVKFKITRHLCTQIGYEPTNRNVRVSLLKHQAPYVASFSKFWLHWNGIRSCLFESQSAKISSMTLSAKSLLIQYFIPSLGVDILKTYSIQICISTASTYHNSTYSASFLMRLPRMRCFVVTINTCQLNLPNRQIFAF